MKQTKKQKTDIAMLKHAIEMIKDGGHLMAVHVAKTEEARLEILRTQKQLSLLLSEKLK